MSPNFLDGAMKIDREDVTDMNRELLQKYATFAVKVAAGLQKGQTLIIHCPATHADFAVMCAEEGYRVGAREVVTFFSDDRLQRMKMQNCDLNVLTDIKPYIERQQLDYIEGEGGAVLLRIIGRDPELYKGIDSDKVEAANKALNIAAENVRRYIMNGLIQWTIVAVPTATWNKKVFPGLDEQQAEEKMWEAIFQCSRVSGGEPEREWAEYLEKTLKRRALMNEHRFTSIRMTAANGTDLTVGLADDHIWEGGDEATPQGNHYIANVPTEEIFTAPHRERVNGIVYGTKPYIYNGDVIDNFCVRFKDGKAVEYTAEVGGDLLKKMIEGDEGSCRIGEIALVDKHSGVGKSNLLYYNTLYDENAACHIAFGEAYPTCVKGGVDMTREQLTAKGVNHSLWHEDVMVGSDDMDIVGIKADGTEIQIFKNGEFCF